MQSKVEKSDGWQISVRWGEFRIRLFTHVTAALGLAVRNLKLI